MGGKLYLELLSPQKRHRLNQLLQGQFWTLLIPCKTRGMSTHMPGQCRHVRWLFLSATLDEARLTAMPCLMALSILLLVLCVSKVTYQKHVLVSSWPKTCGIPWKKTCLHVWCVTDMSDIWSCGGMPGVLGCMAICSYINASECSLAHICDMPFMPHALPGGHGCGCRRDRRQCLWRFRSSLLWTTSQQDQRPPQYYCSRRRNWAWWSRVESHMKSASDFFAGRRLQVHQQGHAKGFRLDSLCSCHPWPETSLKDAQNLTTRKPNSESPFKTFWVHPGVLAGLFAFGGLLQTFSLAHTF